MSYENLPPRVAKLIMREIRQLAKNPPDGVKFVPGDEDCLNEIYADINGPGACMILRASSLICVTHALILVIVTIIVIVATTVPPPPPPSFWHCQ